MNHPHIFPRLEYDNFKKMEFNDILAYIFGLKIKDNSCFYILATSEDCPELFDHDSLIYEQLKIIKIESLKNEWISLHLVSNDNDENIKIYLSGNKDLQYVYFIVETPSAKISFIHCKTVRGFIMNIINNKCISGDNKCEKSRIISNFPFFLIVK